jgi:hypothetical protein
MRRMLQGSSRPGTRGLWECIRRQLEPNFVYRETFDSFASAACKQMETFVFTEECYKQSVAGLSTTQIPQQAAGDAMYHACIRAVLEQLLHSRADTISSLTRCVRHATRTFKLDLHVAMIPAIRAASTVFICLFNSALKLGKSYNQLLSSTTLHSSCSGAFAGGTLDVR